MAKIRAEKMTKSQRKERYKDRQRTKTKTNLCPYTEDELANAPDEQPMLNPFWVSIVILVPVATITLWIIFPDYWVSIISIAAGLIVLPIIKIIEFEKDYNVWRYLNPQKKRSRKIGSRKKTTAKIKAKRFTSR